MMGEDQVALKMPTAAARPRTETQQRIADVLDIQHEIDQKRRQGPPEDIPEIDREVTMLEGALHSVQQRTAEVVASVRMVLPERIVADLLDDPGTAVVDSFEISTPLGDAAAFAPAHRPPDRAGARHPRAWRPAVTDLPPDVNGHDVRDPEAIPPALQPRPAPFGWTLKPVALRKPGESRHLGEITLLHPLGRFVGFLSAKDLGTMIKDLQQLKRDLEERETRDRGPGTLTLPGPGRLIVPGDPTTGG